MSVKQSLMLDKEKGKLVKTSGRVGKTIEGLDAKAVASLKSHCEAERRRRDKINAHLATLQGLLPNNKKMDKATLLAEVITQVKQLKKTAIQISKDLNIPMDTDEVKVEKLGNNAGNRSFLMKASICCEYRPDLLSGLRKTIKDLSLQLVKCEISTLGGRLKTVLLMATSEEWIGDEELIVSSVRSALSNILDKVSASAEFAEQFIFPQKRRRVSIDS